MPIVDDRRADTEAAPTAFTCRRLLPGESHLYRELRLESLARFADAYGATYDEEHARRRLAFEEAIDASAADRFVAGGFLGVRLAGIACFARREGAKKRHRGEISQVFVAPEARGRAAATALMWTTLDLAFALDDLDQLELSLVTTNESALRLYSRLGFATYAVQPNYFKQGGRSWDQRHMLLTRAAYRAYRNVARR